MPCAAVCTTSVGPSVAAAAGAPCCAGGCCAGGFCACAVARPAVRHTAVNKTVPYLIFLDSGLPWLFVRLTLIVGPLGLTVGSLLVVAATTLGRKVGEELVDQTLENDCRLRLVDMAAFLKVGIQAPGAQADELAAEQSRGLDARKAVLRDLVVLRVHAHGDYRLVVFGVEADTGHLTDTHTRDGDRRAHLEITDVVEFGGD